MWRVDLDLSPFDRFAERVLLAILVFSLLFLVPGCAAFETPVKAEYRKPAVMVVWVETEDLTGPCRNERALGCAEVDTPTHCTIFTRPNPEWSTLGHELGHCFLGRWHE